MLPATPKSVKTRVAPPLPSPSNTKQTVSPSPSKAQDRRNAPSPTPSADKTPPSNQTNPAPAPPLTSSRDVRKQASSAKAMKDVPPKPKMPNLVLPTWGDTFYCAPRSLRPPTQVSTLKRTFDAVSRLLVTPAPLSNPELESYQQERKKRLTESLSQIPISPSRPPEVYEEEQRRMARIVGADLPRAWSILDNGMHGTDIGSTKRIVVIGVHGYVYLNWVALPLRPHLTSPPPSRMAGPPPVNLISNAVL